jgi:Tfp pilus assembly protein PilX
MIYSYKQFSSGFALITSIFIMLLMLTLGLYATSFVLTEMKISGSQSNSVKTYYLAESGIAEAIWRIKNDAAWKNGFEGSAAWSVDFTRNSALYPAGSYRIQISNTEKAKGNIIVTATLGLDGTVSQRVVKTNVYKAMGESVIGQNGEFADGNIDMSGSNLHVYNGGFFSNGNIIINFWSNIIADGDVQAVGNINVNQSSHITASSTRDRSSTPPPISIAMPAVSFDDAGDPLSYKSRANHIYTAKQFSDLLFANRNKTLTLNGINYVTGAAEILYNNDLIINGALVADGNITVGKDYAPCVLLLLFGWSTFSDITINNDGSGAPSGLLSKGRIDFETCLGSFNGKGLIYANDFVKILSIPKKFDLTGALIGRKITLTSLWEGVNLTYDNTMVNNAIGLALFSPIVTVEHWEEEY